MALLEELGLRRLRDGLELGGLVLLRLELTLQPGELLVQRGVLALDLLRARRDVEARADELADDRPLLAQLLPRHCSRAPRQVGVAHLELRRLASRLELAHLRLERGLALER